MPSHRYVRSISLDPFHDRKITSGALRLLGELVSRCGPQRRAVTLTKSLATLLGCCTNTVRNWRRDLVAAGWITWDTSPRTGVAYVTLREGLETPSGQAALRAAEQRAAGGVAAPVWPHEGKPPVSGGGAQETAPIKTRINKPFYLYRTARVARGEPQPPRMTVAEMLEDIREYCRRKGQVVRF